MRDLLDRQRRMEARTRALETRANHYYDTVGAFDDTPWFSLTGNGPWSVGFPDGSQPAQVRIKANRVAVRGVFYNSVNQANPPSLLGHLPPGFVPGDEITSMVSYPVATSPNDGKITPIVAFRPNGEVYLVARLNYDDHSDVFANAYQLGLYGISYIPKGLL